MTHPGIDRRCPAFAARPLALAIVLATALAVLASPVVGAVGGPGSDPGDSPATPSPMTRQLCTRTDTACSIRVASALREGAATNVAVTGRASTNVRIRLFRIDVRGTTIRGIEPFGATVDVAVGDNGRGNATLPIAPFDADESAGWVLVSVADARWQGDPSVIVGEIVPIAGRSPMLLGDGYGNEKPVGATLDMELVGQIPGTEFRAEYLGDDDQWHNVTVEVATRDDPSGQTVGVLRYAVPNGLLAKPYRSTTVIVTALVVIVVGLIAVVLFPALAGRRGRLRLDPR